MLGGNAKIVSKALEPPALYKLLRVFMSRPALLILSFMTSEMPSLCRVDFLPLAKLNKDTVTFSKPKEFGVPEGQTVQLKDADPNELQLFIDKMPATIKGKSVKYGF